MSKAEDKEIYSIKRGNLYKLSWISFQKAIWRLSFYSSIEWAIHREEFKLAQFSWVSSL